MSPVDGDDGTPAVVAYRLGQVEQALRELVDKVVSRERYDVDMRHVREDVDALGLRVDQIEQNRTAGNRWTVGVVVSIVAALISLAAVGVAVVAIVVTTKG